ncbi:hypothetical protein [Sphingomonas sp. Leaf21]|uniref:hypothetical protein n=1 Tax=Sphingomonas sp. Leaf21 TaxID=2876550 RepID=UPI001E65AF4A|nr:hypothetical protein [Sphingomonas sp. Leaf21]
MSVLLALALQVAAQPTKPQRQVSRADLNAMADACHAPRNWLVLRGREVVFRGNPDADFAKIECVLKKVSAVVSMNKIGVIGNAPASEDK